MAFPDMPPLGTDTGGWSDGDQAVTFIRWVGEHTRWSVTKLGESLQGRDLLALTLGTGPAEHTMMIVAGVHGTEKMSSEGILVWVREIANLLDDGDPDLEAVLSRIRLVVIPMANPDGRTLNRYGNSQSIDPAQDGFNLQTREREALNLAFRTWDPLLVTDHHEYSPSVWVSMWTGCNRGDVHPDILELSQDVASAMRDRAEADGESTLEYPIQNRRALVHEATFRHAVGVLIETAFGESRIPRETAYNLHRYAIEEAIRVFDTRITEFVSARAASIERALTAPGPERVRIDQLEAVPGDLQPHRLWGYQVSDVPQKYVDAFGLEIVDGYVNIWQEARGFLVELFDPDNDLAPVPGVRMISPPGSPSQAFVMVDGVRREVVQMFHMVDGVREPVWFA